MEIKHIIASATACMMTWAATAQDLNTEITIEREVVPEQRAAARPDILPRLLLPDVEPVKLNMADRNTMATITPYMSPLEPADMADSVTSRKWLNGYINAGYLPTTDLTVNAGINAHKGNCTGSICVFGNRQDYSGFSRSNMAADLKASYHNRHKAWLDIELLANMGEYDIKHDQAGTRSSHDTGNCILTVGGGAWVKDSWMIDLGLDIKWASFEKNGSAPTAVDSRTGTTVDVSNTAFNLHLATEWDYNGSSFWGLALGHTGTDASSCPNYEYGSRQAGKESFSKDMTLINPYYRYRSDRLTAKIGVTAYFMNTDLDDIASGSLIRNPSAFGKTTLVSPEIKLAWTPDASFTAWANWTGAGYSNHIGDLMNTMPMADMDFTIGHSRIPVNIDAGVNLGPWQGASLQLHANYANAEDWLLPAGTRAAITATDIDGFLLGASFRYDYRSLLSVGMSYDRVVNDNIYYLWRDGAKSQFIIRADVHPTDKLNLNLAYTNRLGRHSIGETVNSLGTATASQDYGTVSSLDFGASYNLRSNINLFVSLENLLCKRWQLIGNVPAPRLHGLAGATFKF